MTTYGSGYKGKPTTRFDLALVRSYVIQEMRMLAVTWENDTRGKLVFWLHAAVRRGHLAVR